MIIIVDGYNVLKQIIGGYIDARQRYHFVNKMQIYAANKGHQLKIVFDGTADDVAYKRWRHVEVIYAGGGCIADDIIQDLIDTYAKKDVLLVSDDRALNEFASERSVASIGSRDFYNFVYRASEPQKRYATNHQCVKITESSNALLDELMNAASYGVQIKKNDKEAVSDVMSKKKSKLERLLIKKIEKL